MSYIAARLALLKMPALRLHVFGCIAATMGMGMTYLAMTWTVVNEHHNVSSVAWLMACFWLPGVIMAPITGAITDRFQRRKVVMFANVARIIALLIFSYCYQLNADLLYIYLLATCCGFCASLYGPAAMAMVREMVSQDKLLYANATLDMAYELGFMLGMQLGGFLLVLFSPATVFLANAICFIVPTLTTLAIRKKWLNITVKDKITGFGEDIIEGLRYLKRKKNLQSLYFIQLFIYMALMTTPILLAPFAKDILQVTAVEFGFIEAALSLGVVIGSLITPMLAQQFSDTKMIMIGTLGMTGLFSLFAVCYTVNQAIFLYFLIGLCLSSWALITTKAQHATDIAYQGRMQTTFNALAGIGILTVFFVVGSASQFITVRWSYLSIILMAFISFSISYYVFVIKVKRRVEKSSLEKGIA